MEEAASVETGSVEAAARCGVVEAWRTEMAKEGSAVRAPCHLIDRGDIVGFARTRRVGICLEVDDS